jgi:putative SOS response-associated peptidase YedK
VSDPQTGRKCSASPGTLVHYGRVVKETNCGNARRESDEPANPAEGYYEWQKTEDGKKIPNYLYSEKTDLLAFAGLYEFWPDQALPEDQPGKWLLSCTVLTTTAHDTLGHIHDRSPAIIPPEMFADWLDPETRDKADVQSLLDSVPEPVLTPRIVTDRVNSVRNNGPELLDPAEA